MYVEAGHYSVFGVLFIFTVVLPNVTHGCHAQTQTFSVFSYDS